MLCRSHSSWSLILAVPWPRLIIVRNRFVYQARILVVAKFFGVKVCLYFQITTELVCVLQLARICVQNIADDFTVRLILILALSTCFVSIGVATLLAQTIASIFLNRSHFDATLRPRVELGNYLALINWRGALNTLILEWEMSLLLPSLSLSLHSRTTTLLVCTRPMMPRIALCINHHRLFQVFLRRCINRKNFNDLRTTIRFLILTILLHLNLTVRQSLLDIILLLRLYQYGTLRSETPGCLNHKWVLLVNTQWLRWHIQILLILLATSLNVIFRNYDFLSLVFVVRVNCALSCVVLKL